MTHHISASTAAHRSLSKRIVPSPPEVRPRFLSETDCHDIADRLARFAVGGGYTTTTIVSTWRGNIRWARNQISTGGEDRNNHIVVGRNVRGARNGFVHLNETSDHALVAAIRRAERLAALQPEQPDYDLGIRLPFEPFTATSLFSEATYQLDADHLAMAAKQLAQSATDAGMLSAGYIEVSAKSIANITSYGIARYFQYTWAQYSVTVRDPSGSGSGWAGVDWPDWRRIDGARLSALALDKCLRSRHPVAIEPGRYTTILEPQAVCALVGNLMFDTGGSTPFENGNLTKRGNEESDGGVFNKTPSTTNPPGFARLGERVVDERITISADLLDPELGFPPFIPFDNMYDASDLTGAVFHPVTWIEHGVLKTLAYNRGYAITTLGRNTGLPNAGAFQMSGGDTSIEEMIATTKRGLIVTRFDSVEGLDRKSQLCRGFTRDGLWLIENGKLSKAVKNMIFTESVLFALNNVEQLGMPQRVFHPPDGGWPEVTWWDAPQPVIVPALKVRDFSFTALCDAV